MPNPVLPKEEAFTTSTSETFAIESLYALTETPSKRADNTRALRRFNSLAVLLSFPGNKLSACIALTTAKNNDETFLAISSNIGRNSYQPTILAALNQKIESLRKTISYLQHIAPQVTPQHLLDYIKKATKDLEKAFGLINQQALDKHKIKHNETEDDAQSKTRQAIEKILYSFVARQINDIDLEEVDIILKAKILFFLPYKDTESISIRMHTQEDADSEGTLIYSCLKNTIVNHADYFNKTFVNAIHAEQVLYLALEKIKLIKDNRFGITKPPCQTCENALHDKNIQTSDGSNALYSSVVNLIEQKLNSPERNSPEEHVKAPASDANTAYIGYFERLSQEMMPFTASQELPGNASLPLVLTASRSIRLFPPAIRALGLPASSSCPMTDIDPRNIESFGSQDIPSNGSYQNT